jgi:hypothetical protein
MSKDAKLQYPLPEFVPADIEGARSLREDLRDNAAWLFRFCAGGLEVVQLNDVTPALAQSLYDAGLVELAQARLNAIWHVQYVIPRKSHVRSRPFFSHREAA